MVSSNDHVSQLCQSFPFRDSLLMVHLVRPMVGHIVLGNILWLSYFTTLGNENSSQITLILYLVRMVTPFVWSEDTNGNCQVNLACVKINLALIILYLHTPPPPRPPKKVVLPSSQSDMSFVLNLQIFQFYDDLAACRVYNTLSIQIKPSH